MRARPRIVVGYDRESGGRDAVMLSRGLAGVLATRRLIVTALPWPTYLAPPDDLDQMAQLDMAEEFTRLRESEGDAELETRAVPSGSAARALHVAAEDAEAEMIVLGSCHRGAIGRTMLGSVGESLMHGAPCAIAVAPRGYAERDEQRLLRVAAAFDGSPESQEALQTAAAIARRTHGELTLISAAAYPRYGYAEAWTALSAGEIIDADKKRKQALLEEAIDALAGGPPATGVVATGSPGDVLADMSGDFDLLVLGSRGYGSLHRVLLGSTSRKVIRAAECPVLVLPRGAEAGSLGLESAAAVGAG
jgi:nucleotide-binding universal stress UspA family protein